MSFEVLGVDEVAEGLTASLAALEEGVAAADEAAAKLVAKDAQMRAAALGSVAAHSASGVVADGPAVALDGSMPTIFGAEYGGQGRPSTMQFQPFDPEGYFAGPAAEAAGPEVDSLYGAVADRAFGGI